MVDSATGRTTTYYYDLTDRLMQTVVRGNSGYYHSVGYEYSTQNDSLTKVIEKIGAAEKTTTYTYDDDNRVESISDGTSSRTNAYDDYSRIESQTTTHKTGENTASTVLTDSYTYLAPTDSTTTSLISSHTIMASGYGAVYNYTYDGRGNITAIYLGEELLVAYTYDSANQLIREDNAIAGKSWSWSYDSAGNIGSKWEYDYSKTENNLTQVGFYTYGDSSWGDLLTVYNGKTIEYDTIGNPLSDGTWNYTWQYGRQLASMGRDADNDGNIDLTWSYTYDANGMRTGRTDGTTSYQYVYNGSQLSQMTVGSNTLRFSYDSNGKPLSVTLNGTTYYYVTTTQGDVIAILDAAGAAVATYSYDAWGNPVSSSNSATGSNSSATTTPAAPDIGQLNPLRYRGYVYDSETQLYYLQSRYYNPTTGRFLNADAFTSTGQGLLGNNMFAYCLNNPVMLCDPEGSCAYCASEQDRRNCSSYRNTENIVDAVINFLRSSTQKLQKMANSVDGWTVNRGVFLAGGFGVAGSASVGITCDIKGNIGLYATVFAGGGLPTASFNGIYGFTTAPNIYEQRGHAFGAGGSVDIGAGVGCEYYLFRNDKTDATYHGVSVCGGVGLSLPAELHGGVSYTWVKGVNVFETLYGIYDWLEG